MNVFVDILARHLAPMPSDLEAKESNSKRKRSPKHSSATAQAFKSNPDRKFIRPNRISNRRNSIEIKLGTSFEDQTGCSSPQDRGIFDSPVNKRSRSEQKTRKSSDISPKSLLSRTLLFESSDSSLDISMEVVEEILKDKEVNIEDTKKMKTLAIATLVQEVRNLPQNVNKIVKDRLEVIEKQNDQFDQNFTKFMNGVDRRFNEFEKKVNNTIDVKIGQAFTTAMGNQQIKLANPRPTDPWAAIDPSKPLFAKDPERASTIDITEQYRRAREEEEASHEITIENVPLSKDRNEEIQNAIERVKELMGEEFELKYDPKDRKNSHVAFGRRHRLPQHLKNDPDAIPRYTLHIKDTKIRDEIVLEAKRTYDYDFKPQIPAYVNEFNRIASDEVKRLNGQPQKDPNVKWVLRGGPIKHMRKIYIPRTTPTKRNRTPGTPGTPDSKKDPENTPMDEENSENLNGAQGEDKEEIKELTKMVQEMKTRIQNLQDEVTDGQEIQGQVNILIQALEMADPDNPVLDQFRQASQIY